MFKIENQFEEEIPFKTFNFSAGEVHVEVDVDKLNLGDSCKVTANIKSSNDVMTFLMILSALSKITTISEVVIPYMPYSRQDRVCAKGQAFGLQVFVRQLNSIFETLWTPPLITTWDAHSKETEKLIVDQGTMLFDNIGAESFVADLVEEGIIGPEFSIVAPDKGAVNRAKEVASITDSNVIYCTKERDPATGKLSPPKIEGDYPEECDLLVVDDICDGGWTFINLGKMLKHNIRGKLILYVTHGIFSKGFVELLEIYDEIYTANSFIPESQLPSRVKIIK